VIAFQKSKIEVVHQNKPRVKKRFTVKGEAGDHLGSKKKGVRFADQKIPRRGREKRNTLFSIENHTETGFPKRKK